MNSSLTRPVPWTRGRIGFVLVLTVLTSFSLLTTELNAADGAPTVTRLFWQDRSTQQLHAADVRGGRSWKLKRLDVPGFPRLDCDTQNLVQMNQTGGMLVIGVRDNDGGQVQSGWIAVATGVVEEPHGDHTHWRYSGRPRVTHSRLDTAQGNPAHLYVYDNAFFLANDAKNGFTRIDPEVLSEHPSQDAGVFFEGGGNHITLAATGNVAYSTWIDGGGPNAGRVDVVDLAGRKTTPAYSLTLPSGAIHGATTNSGRVFFAPADGICWLTADVGLSGQADTAVVHHLSLGSSEEDDRPLRTGAFETHRNWVLFSTGQGEQSALGIIDATAKSPSIQKVPLAATDGLRPTPPAAVLSTGRRYALCFLDRADREVDDQEQLMIVELDPNRDHDLSDAAVVATLPVSPSRIKGNFGHHDVAFDAYGRYAFVSLPDEGKIGVLRLKNRKWIAEFDVGGHPDSLLAVGGTEFDD